MVTRDYFEEEDEGQKCLFKSKLGTISQKELIPIDNPFWQTLYSNDGLTFECVFIDIKASEIRRMISDNLINFQTFIRYTCMEFVSTAHQIRLKNENFTVLISRVLKIIRVITRFFPFFIECDKSGEYEQSIFWSKKRLHLLTTEQQEPDSGKATIGTGSLLDSSEVPDSDSASIKVNIDEPYVTRDPQSTEGDVNGSDGFEPFELPLGAQMMNDCVNLLFTREFTSPPMEEKLPEFYDSGNIRGEEYCFWEPGIGMNGHFTKNNFEIDLHRLEIIRLIFVLCSREMTLNVNDVFMKGSRFLTVLTTCTPGFMIETLVYSLVNLTCKECKVYFSNNVNDKHLLYSSEMNCKKEQLKIRRLYITYVFQLLALILIYPIPADDSSFLKDLNIIGTNTNIRNTTNGKIRNLVRVCVSKIFKKAEIFFIISSYLRYFQKFVKEDCKKEEPHCFPLWSSEITIILWEFCQINNRFVKYLTRARDIETNEIWSNELTILLLYFIICYYNTINNRNKSNIGNNNDDTSSISILTLEKFSVDLVVCFSFYLSSNPFFEASVVNNINFTILSGDISDIFLIEHYKEHELFFNYRDMILYNLCHLLIFELNSVDESILYVLVKIMYNLIALSGSSNSVQITFYTSASIIQFMEKLYNKVIIDVNDTFLNCLNLFIKVICQTILFSGKNESCQNTIMLILAIMNKQKFFKQIKTMSTDEEGLNFNSAILSESLKRSFSFISSSDDDPNSTKEEDQDVSEFSLEDTEKSANSIDFMQTTLPPGMSKKAKGKLPMNQSHLITWNGFLQNDIILSLIEHLKKKDIKFHFFADDKCSSAIKKQEVMKVQRFISQIEKHISKSLQVLNYSTKHKSNKYITKPSKFVWSKSSLGWYKGIIWSCIFIAEYNINFNNNNREDSSKYDEDKKSFVPKFLISIKSRQSRIPQRLLSSIDEEAHSEREIFSIMCDILFSKGIFEEVTNQLLHSIVNNTITKSNDKNA